MTISNREKWIRKQSAIRNFLVPHKRRSVPTTLSGDIQNALGCDCMKAEHIRSRSPLIMIKSLLNHNRHLVTAECVISFGKVSQDLRVINKNARVRSLLVKENVHQGLLLPEKGTQ